MLSPLIRADFNGLFGDLLCLSHTDTVKNQAGEEIRLRPGMEITVFDFDADEHGNPDNLFASGIVEPSPEWLSCRGSKWVLRIDSNGCRHESDMARGA